MNQEPLTSRQGRTDERAYKQAGQTTECGGLEAINGYFQAPVLGPEDLACQLVQGRLQFLKIAQVTSGESMGSNHPDILKAVSQGQTVSITKDAFLGPRPNESGVFSKLPPKMEWERLVELKNPGKNWVENESELSRIRQITISPQDWLATQQGIGTYELTRLINLLLSSKSAPTWNHLQGRAHQFSISPSMASPELLGNTLENQLAQHPDLAIPVIMWQSQEGSAPHYHTIIPDASGNWLSLNPKGTRAGGVQQCEVWAQKGQLANKLSQSGAVALIYGAPNT